MSYVNGLASEDAIKLAFKAPVGAPQCNNSAASTRTLHKHHLCTSPPAGVHAAGPASTQPPSSASPGLRRWRCLQTLQRLLLMQAGAGSLSLPRPPAGERKARVGVGSGAAEARAATQVVGYQRLQRTERPPNQLESALQLIACLH